MNDKQQLAAMGEHMREMEECNQQKHGATQVLAWAGDYEKDGGHGLIVEMLKSYAEILAKSHCNPEFKVPGGWRLVPDIPNSEMIIKGGEEFFDSARAWERGVTITDQDYAIMIYCQMLAAAPEYKPEQAKPEFCESVMRSIPEPEAKPTIEQLASDYCNRKDYAERKQQEADAAKVATEAKLAELVAAGKVLGLVLSIAGVEPELGITVKVGDEVECVKPNIKPSKYKGMIGTVLEVDDSSTPYLVDFKGEDRIWCHEVKFIRRP